MSHKPGDISSVQSQTEHRQAPHAPHGASPAPGCPSWPSPTNSGHVPLRHMPPPWRQHGLCLVQSCPCPHNCAHQQRVNTASSGFKWGVRALGGSQPLLDTHQPVEFGFQARHVCSELSELRIQTQRASLKVPCGSGQLPVLRAHACPGRTPVPCFYACLQGQRVPFPRTPALWNPRDDNSHGYGITEACHTNTLQKVN